MKDQMFNIKDSQPIKGDKIIFLTDKHLVSGMSFNEVKDNKGIAKCDVSGEEESFEYWAYSLEF